MKIDANTRNAIVAQHLKTPKGRRIIAESLREPLRFFQEYIAVGRKAMSVRPLGNGEPPLIDHDVDKNSLAYVVANKGQDIQKMIDPETQRIQMFEIAANPRIDYVQIAARTYDLKARVQEVTTNEIVRVEDRKIFQTLLAAGTHKHYPLVFQKDKTFANPVFNTKKDAVAIPGNPVNKITTTTRANANIDTISQAMSEIEKHGLKPVNLFMNPFNAQLLRKINQNNNNGYYVDFETSSELIRTGFLATLFGLDIYTTTELPVDTILVTAAPELTGVILERIPLSVLPYDEPGDRAYKYSVFENIGVACHNPAAVAAITIS